MPRWMVELVGERFDLEYLREQVCSAELGVTEEDGRFYLQAAEFESLSNIDGVRSQAKTLLQHLNGAAKLDSPSFKLVEIGSAVREGQKMHQVIEVASINIRCKLGVADILSSQSQKNNPEHTNIEIWSVVASRYPEVAKVLVLLASEETTSWGTLYKVYEGVWSDVRGAMYENGWIRKSEASLFRRTANSPLAIGDEAARHGYQKEQPPPNPMSLTQARSLIGNLAKRWILSKCS